MAALNGHWEVAHELIQEHGIDGCGGIYGGVQALFVAAQNQHVLVMEVLTRAGVIDSGSALHTAARFGRELSLKSLLQQRKQRRRCPRKHSRHTRQNTLGLCHRCMLSQNHEGACGCGSEHYDTCSIYKRGECGSFRRHALGVHEL